MKKYSLVLFLTLIGFSFAGCEKSPESILLTFNNFLTNIHIHYVTNTGENILNKNSVVEVFYDDNGAMYKVDRPHLDAPNGYKLEYNDRRVILKLFTSDFFTIRDRRLYSKTYVKLDDYATDTLSCQLYARGATLSVVRLWHNDNLVWEEGEILNSTPRFITIVK